MGAVNDSVVSLKEHCTGTVTSHRHVSNVSEKRTYNESNLDGKHEKSIDKQENPFGSVLSVLKPSSSKWTFKKTHICVDSSHRKRKHNSDYFQHFPPKTHNTNLKLFKKNEDKKGVITKVKEVQNVQNMKTLSPDLCMNESESIIDKDRNNTVIENSAFPFLQNVATENTPQNECISSQASFHVNFDLCFSPGFYEESPLPDVNKDVCSSVQEQKDPLCVSSSKQVPQIQEFKDKGPVHSEGLKENDSKSYIVNITDKKDSRMSVVAELQGSIQAETEISAINHKKTNAESRKRSLKFSAPFKLQDQKGSILLDHWIKAVDASTKFMDTGESKKQVFEIIKEASHTILQEIKNAEVICILMCNSDKVAVMHSRDETLTALIKCMDGQTVKKHFYAIPLTSINEDTRNLVIHMLSSEAVVSFDAKNLISCLVSKLKIEYKTGTVMVIISKN
ncbi:uncharacterized protein LOC111088922 [Limulus polyphemus]|uniref:Uncharacterized protein LOC111088922 n=1 Tax=Limulus polyphemus TaxID=6850 RepID=A0ABM1TJB4_LIMPO|nr:uncharacterized protein LOC111088922 [Limulus polyphemus]